MRERVAAARRVLARAQTAVRTAGGWLRTPLEAALVAAVVAAWAGFWALVARLHYLHGDVVPLLVTGAIAVAPVAVALSYAVTSGDTLRRRALAAVPGIGG